MPAVVGYPPGSNVRRTNRRPQHPYFIRQFPWGITPFFIAPVVPGETVKSVLLQARVVSEPIINPLVGWHLEYYFFYVKLSDIPIMRTEDNMRALIDPAYDWADIITAAGGTTANLAHYFAGGAGMVNWVQLCLEQVVNWYFRDEGEVAGDHTLTDTAGVVWYAAALGRRTAIDSALLEDAYDAQDVSITVGVDDVITMSELHTAMDMYEALRRANLIEMNYEDWLRAYGVKPPVTEQTHRPELIRFMRHWQYPTNTIDPSNGTPRSALSWSIAERADKDRYCREPGFLFGVTVVRPKVYLGNVDGTFSSAMNSSLAWLPPGTLNDPRLRMRPIAHDAGPLATVVTDTDGYRFDIGDLLKYGEDFRNRDGTDGQTTPNSGQAPAMALPNAALTNRDYVSTADNIYNLFVDEDGTNSAVYVKQDGIVSLDVATSVHDVTPRGGPKSVVV